MFFVCHVRFKLSVKVQYIERLIQKLVSRKYNKKNDYFVGIVGAFMTKEQRFEQLQKQVAKSVQSVLDEKEWSLSQFAERLGKSKSHVYAIINEEANLTLRVIAEIEEVLGKKLIKVEV